MISDLISIAWKGLVHRKLRSVLTVIGVIIGVGAIVAMISISKGFETSISDIMEQFGADNIIITPGSNFMAASVFAPTPLTDNDVDVVKRVPGIAEVAGVAAKTMEVRVGPEKRALIVYGYPPESFETFYGSIIETYLESGRSLRENDHYVALIGNDVAHNVFSKDLEPGRSIYINGKRFRIIGVLRRAGDDQDDLSVSIPLEAFEEITGDEETTYMMIMAKLKPGADPQSVADKIKRKLKQARGQEDFQVLTAEDMLNQINSILGVISAIVLGIAAIALIVGAVGIMNTMYMSVMERTREIGVMKAVGAKKWQILTIFLVEAGIIGLTGALIGEGLALGFAKLVEYGVRTRAGISYYSVYTGLDLLIGAAAFGFIIGTVAGYLPARHAAELNPVEALRYE